MDLNFNEQADRYVKGLMTEAERKAFEGKLVNAAELQQAVENHQQLVDAMVELGQRQQLRENLHEIHREEIAEPARKKSQYLTFSAIAAAVALISISATWFIVQKVQSRESEFIELRRVVNNLERKQNALEKNVAAVKPKKNEWTGKYAGSSFLISKNGYLITSYHLVKDADSVNIENEKFGRLGARVVFTDKANDVAVLKIDTAIKTVPFAMAKDEAKLAEEVYTLGFPREDIVFGEGSVSALTGFKGNPNSYQVSVPVNPGNSGGPLLNAKGEWVGMISGVETGIASASFAVKSTILSEILTSDSLKAKVQAPKLNYLRGLPRVQQVEQWKDFVFMVLVYKQ